MRTFIKRLILCVAFVAGVIYVYQYFTHTRNDWTSFLISWAWMGDGILIADWANRSKDENHK